MRSIAASDYAVVMVDVAHRRQTLWGACDVPLHPEGGDQGSVAAEQGGLHTGSEGKDNGQNPLEEGFPRGPHMLAG